MVHDLFKPAFLIPQFLLALTTNQVNRLLQLLHGERSIADDLHVVERRVHIKYDRPVDLLGK